MVCKEDVVTWFKSLKSYNRIDVMCSLLNSSLPFELRFLGTCLEDLGKRDFHDLRNSENGANSLSEISSLDIQCISDKRARTKLAVYISLLRSCNYECANGLYKILANFDEVNNILKSNLVLNTDDETLEELLLLYTLALNHPAFTFEQKLSLGSIFSKLQEEELRLEALKRSRSLLGSSELESMNEKPKQYQSCPMSEQETLRVNTSHCTQLPTTTGETLVSIPEQLNALSYLRFNYSAPLMTTPWSQVVLSTNEPQSSPLVSQKSSPCQSNSPSRAGSPGKPKSLPTIVSTHKPPPRTDTGESLSKEMSNSIDQLRGMCDDELNYGAIQQLRSIINKSQVPNGLTIDSVKKKPDSNTSEPNNETPTPRRYVNIDNTLTSPGLIYTVGPPPVICNGNPQCYTCYIGSRTPHNRSLHPQFLDQMKALRLDADNCLHTSNSSASDSASDHSPPDTPSLSTHSDRGPPSKDAPTGEISNNFSCTDEQQRPHSRSRGLGRSNRSNLQGIQNIPRGRGPNPNNRRRDIGSSNGVLEDRKGFTGNESGNPFPYSPNAPSPYIPPTHFMRSAAYPFGPGNFLRTTFPFPTHPNGDLVYQYPPPPPQPFIPSGPAPGPNPLSYSMAAPPPKISCYNCGSQNHMPSECQDPTIEEITKQGQYRIDYNPYPKSGECSSGNQEK
uniref:CCHC-type domain-containing protein n=1 Tax=Clastoptera arizonana TaxID=38151 RepID=A0A1B6DUD1_9HEMI